ncbi:MAG: hypothetical protein COA44_06410 [Arcobacter sp.]|nr:MAG: hypothetical protein COA44_06410 [Arcobacter sp.]
MQNTNTINGLFHIPDEGSFLKKLILTYPSVYNPDIVLAFKALKEIHPSLELIHKDKYFSLLLPTQSEGLQLEAMLISTEDKGEKLFSIYHRLHFDEQMYPQGPRVIEADAFLRLSAVLVNVPLSNKLDALASVLNYQVQEALNIEITMLSLADSNTQIVEDNILPFINNAVARAMLASQLDDGEYIRPMTKDDLSRLVSGYCDLPLVNVATGIDNLADFMDDIIKSENAFVPNFASSTLCLMLLLIEKKTSSAMLDTGNFKTIKEFLIDNKEIYKLRDITGEGEMLGNFEQLTND